MPLDDHEIERLFDLIEKLTFTELRIESGDLRIVVRRGGPAAQSAEMGAAENSVQQTAAGAHGDSEPGGANAVGGDRAVAAASAQPGVAAEQAAGTPEPALQRGSHVVSSPMLGTFYAAPKPNEPPYVTVGQSVRAGDVLGLIEVMKMMNSVVADVEGTIATCEVQNGSFVEYGQALFTMMPVGFESSGAA